MSSRRAFVRNLFDIQNAKNLTVNELVQTFIPTRNFWELFSTKNHVILGSRGSGKTAIIKMLSHNHLSKSKSERAQKIIQTKEFIGIYMSSKVGWVSSLKNKPWLCEKSAERFFQWKLNVLSCLALLTTTESCLNTFYKDVTERTLIEKKVVIELSDAWFKEKTTFNTIHEIRRHIKKLSHQHSIVLRISYRTMNANHRKFPIIYFYSIL